MLGFDVAELYQVETRVFNHAVKGDLESFPKDFMFRLTAGERESILLSQNEISGTKTLKSQNVISSRGGRRKLPYTFTGHGVTMLSSVSKRRKFTGSKIKYKGLGRQAKDWL